MAKKRARKLFSLTRRTAVLAAAAVIVLGVLGYWAWHHKNSSGAATNTSTTAPYVNLNPATNQEKQAADANKNAIVNQQNQSNNSASSSGKRSVTPFITSASASSVKAYVNGVIEDGGTCTATFTQGYTTKTFTSSGVANATNTVCTPISVSGLTGGDWSLVVSYSSATAAGSSAALNVKV